MSNPSRNRPRYFVSSTSVLLVTIISLLTVPSVADAQPKSSRQSVKGKSVARAQQNKKAQAGDASEKQVGKDALTRQSANRNRTSLPKPTEFSQVKGRSTLAARDLKAVQPPRSSDFYENDNSKEAEYERLVDEEIKTLFKLAKANQSSKNRGEIWLRLGERYAEKARLIELRAQAEYDRLLADFLANKIKVKPRLELSPSRAYNRKAVELYEWFVRDFPSDSKIDQALFFLGYNHFELGNTQQGEKFYSELVQRFPESSYVAESRFALAEFYFENEQWERAYDHYDKVIRVKKARLNSFAIYKSAWCLYRMGRIQPALKSLERVIRLSRSSESQSDSSGRKAINKVRLGAEALKDYVPFFAEAGEPSAAADEFRRLASDEKQVANMLERLAYIYADQGNRAGANFVFKQLISLNPGAEKAADFQYQVILSHATVDQTEFRRELEFWLETFGPSSAWARQNAGNQSLLSDVAKLQEATVRNNVLQLHQTAQKSRGDFSQRNAKAAYEQYFKYFPDAPQIYEMRFFHAELLFDMGRHEEAAKSYQWVAESDPSGPYREKAIINALLALEEDLPDSKTIDAKRGNSLQKIPFDPPVARFEKAALSYIANFPKGERISDTQRRLGVLYYGHNQFDEANAIFERILKESPNSPNAEIAGNLLLDSYTLRNDLTGFADKSQMILNNPALASTPLGSQVRGMVEKANYLRAEKALSAGEPMRAAKEFESFASSYKQSKLVGPARFKAAQAYEKAGDISSAMRLYGFVLATQQDDPKFKAVQSDARNALARLYQETGQLALAAREYRAFALANSKDTKAINGLYNAGVLHSALGASSDAIQAFQDYIRLSGSPDRFEALFLKGEIQRNQGDLSKALASFEQYLKVSRKDSQAIQAAFYLATDYSKMNQALKARQGFQRTLDLYRKAKPVERAGAVRFAAEARFELAQETLAQIKSIRFTANEKQQADAAKKIQVLREKYIDEMKEVIRFDNAPMIVAALGSTGLMFETLSNVFAGIPAPDGYSAQDSANYKAALQKEAEKFRGEAVSALQSAIARSQELEAYTTWSQTAALGLARLEKSSVGDVGELSVESKATDAMGL